MWSQEWGNIYDLVQPYPNRTAISVTKAMTDQVNHEVSFLSLSITV